MGSDWRYVRFPETVTRAFPRYNRRMENLYDTAGRILEQVAGVIVPGFRALDREQTELFRSIVDSALVAAESW